MSKASFRIPLYPRSLGRPLGFRKAVLIVSPEYWSATCAWLFVNFGNSGRTFTYILSQRKFTCFSDQDHSGSQCPEDMAAILQPQDPVWIGVSVLLPWPNCLSEDPSAV